MSKNFWMILVVMAVIGVVGCTKNVSPTKTAGNIKVEKVIVHNEILVTTINGINGVQISPTLIAVPKNGTVIFLNLEEPYFDQVTNQKPDPDGLRLIGHIMTKSGMKKISYPTNVIKFGLQIEPIQVQGQYLEEILGSAIVNSKNELVGIVTGGFGRILEVMPVRVLLDMAKQSKQ